jgi:hypothetical protein
MAAIDVYRVAQRTRSMRIFLKTALFAAVAFACGVASADVTYPVNYPDECRPLWDRIDGVIGNHLKIGTRITHQILLDAERTPRDDNGDGTISGDELLRVSFLGSIYKFDVQQNYAPFSPYAQWLVTDNWGVEVGWEHLRAKTYTWWDGHTDGTFDLRGPVLALFAHYRNDTRFTPSAGIGLALLGTKFDHDPDWEVVRQGPLIINQRIETSDTQGFALFAACEVDVTDNLAAEFYCRYLNVSFDGHYTISVGGNVIDDRGITTYPMSSVCFGLGVSYAF